MSSPVTLPSSLPPGQTNYLLFSDVHLGSDLIQHSRPWTVSRLRQVLRLDRELSGMLEHYRAHRDPERPWKLIIAGDLVDFMGMSIAPVEGAVLETPLNDEEHTHGLGSAHDHAVQKMRAVADRHDLVFRKLAEFVADGHSLALIRGNHDVEFYWDAAREAFVQALLDRAPEALGDASVREAFQARIEFHHWFYYVENLLYVEHGHQYDETCSYHHVLMPVSPRDPRRIAYSFSDILMRYVVHPTRGLGMSGHDGNGMADYVRLAFSMGLQGGARLAYRFFSAVRAMLSAWRGHVSARAHELRAENERRVHQVAERLRMSAEKLGALAALSAKPVTGGFFAILRSVFLDLLAAITASTCLLVLLLSTELVPAAYVAPLAIVLGTGIYVWMKSSRVLDPRAALRRGAARVAELMPARFVVMGHTHAPVMESIADGVTYVNLGGWTADDVDTDHGVAPPSPASRTHLVIRHVDGQPHAELRSWCSENGPSVMHAMQAPAESGVHALPHDADERVA